MQFRLDIDTTLFERMMASAKRLDGEAIVFGIPAPAPLHRGKPGRPAKPGLTTAQVLAWVEFGVGKRRRSTTAPSSGGGRRRRSWLGRIALRIRRFLRGFGGRRGRPVPSRKPETRKTGMGRPARPVIRWVAAARRDLMRDGFRIACRDVLRGRDHLPAMEVLRAQLADATRERIIAVEAVDTGQTRDAITAKIVRGSNG